MVAMFMLSIWAGSAGAVLPPSFHFVIESSWSASETAQLQSWLNPNGPVMKTVLQVAGSPATNLTVKVVKESSGYAGEYDPSIHQITLASLRLSVLVHELNHAVRDGWTLSDSIWEEGLARAGEKEDMRLLALQGITEPGYDVTHSYGYDEYYEQNNVAKVGVPNGNIYAEPALELLRYEQAGYAFSKVLMENSAFLAKFNAKVFKRPNGNISQSELIGMAAAVQPEVEGMTFYAWRWHQHIFDVNQLSGCYLFERSNQFTVDLYCTDQYGNVSMQSGASIQFKVTGPNNKEVLFSGSGTTTSYGWTSFEPSLTASIGRVKMVATAQSAAGPVQATFYRQSGGEEGVFGVVTNASTGVVNFSSPSGQFASFGVAVKNGAFVAPSLTSLRGQVVAEFSGEGKSARRTFDKDAAPYSVVFTAA